MSDLNFVDRLSKITAVGLGWCRILPGLPPYGPLAKSFSPNGRGGHSEGLVVEFFPPGNESWVGNFKRGVGRLDTVVHHPDNRHAIVVSGGQGYVIDPISCELVYLLGWDVSSLLPLPERRQIVVSDGIRLELIGPHGLVWKTRRIAWDGIQELRHDGDHVRGQACSVIDDCWYDFMVDLDTGHVVGGAYDENWPQ